MQENSIDNTLDLEGFLALMHDKMVPDYIRSTIDSVEVDVSDDKTIAASESHYERKSSVSSSSYTSISDMNMRWDKPPTVFTEKSYVEIFLQKNRSES